MSGANVEVKYKTGRTLANSKASKRTSQATVDGSNLLNQFCDHVKWRFSAFTCYAIVTLYEQTLMQQQTVGQFHVTRRLPQNTWLFSELNKSYLQRYLLNSPNKISCFYAKM